MRVRERNQGTALEVAYGAEPYSDCEGYGD